MVPTSTIAVVKPTEGEEIEVELATDTPEVVVKGEVEDTEIPTQVATNEESEKGDKVPEKNKPRLCPLPMSIGLFIVVMVSFSAKYRHKRRL